MKRSSERILTTHTGSIPRPDDLIETMRAKENGRPYDREGMAAAVCTSEGGGRRLSGADGQ